MPRACKRNRQEETQKTYLQPYVTKNFEPTVEILHAALKKSQWEWGASEKHFMMKVLNDVCTHDDFYPGPNIQSPRINLERFGRYLATNDKFCNQVNQFCNVYTKQQTQQKYTGFIKDLLDTYSTMRISYMGDTKAINKVYDSLNATIWS